MEERKKRPLCKMPSLGSNFSVSIDRHGPPSGGGARLQHVRAAAHIHHRPVSQTCIIPTFLVAAIKEQLLTFCFCGDGAIRPGQRSREARSHSTAPCAAWADLGFRGCV